MGVTDIIKKESCTGQDLTEKRKKKGVSEWI